MRRNSLLPWIFGIGGRRLPLLRLPPPGAGGRDTLPKVNWLSPGDWLRAIKGKKLGQQDKTSALRNWPTIQGAGLTSDTVRLSTSF